MYVFPCKPITSPCRAQAKAITSIEDELRERLQTLEPRAAAEAQRPRMRTTYDLEMMEQRLAMASRTTAPY